MGRMVSKKNKADYTENLNEKYQKSYVKNSEIKPEQLKWIFPRGMSLFPFSLLPCPWYSAMLLKYRNEAVAVTTQGNKHPNTFSAKQKQNQKKKQVVKHEGSRTEILYFSNFLL